MISLPSFTILDREVEQSIVNGFILMYLICALSFKVVPSLALLPPSLTAAASCIVLQNDPGIFIDQGCCAIMILKHHTQALRIVDRTNN